MFWKTWNWFILEKFDWWMGHHAVLMNVLGNFIFKIEGETKVVFVFTRPNKCGCDVKSTDVRVRLLELVALQLQLGCVPTSMANESSSTCCLGSVCGLAAGRQSGMTSNSKQDFFAFRLLLEDFLKVSKSKLQFSEQLLSFDFLPFRKNTFGNWT